MLVNTNGTYSLQFGSGMTATKILSNSGNFSLNTGTAVDGIHAMLGQSLSSLLVPTSVVTAAYPCNQTAMEGWR